MLFDAAVMFAGMASIDQVNIPDYVTDRSVYCLTIGVGSLLYAVIYAKNAHDVMSRKMTRVEVVRKYLMTVGLCTTAGGVLWALAEYLFTDQPENGLVIAVATIVAGAVILSISAVVANGKKGPAKKVAWGILLVAFAVMAVCALLPAENYWDYAKNISHLLIAFFMLAFITDFEVRKEMGVGC